MSGHVIVVDFFLFYVLYHNIYIVVPFSLLRDFGILKINA